ncbi:hypothetical protein JF66_12660 [Cryobacterium sp. MLB-32]|uniref:aggregation-promoting factor C-terminal-like domain-containing protein n=1 Tax=Cryobacterium sp. MLB-32 TaxID=1529318 RepID=UPI0004E7494A|nr:lytic transglycosylase domain-containing protein [Cryobacterium sp. MLB-32]KFF59267.1 hypothetical protein JF66_12660 [Cryobacterium sp. MLB-32]
MGRHLNVIEPVAVSTGAAVRRTRKPVRVSHFLFGFVAACAFVLVSVVDPYSGATASPYFQVAGDRYAGVPAQAVTIEGSYTNTVTREGYTVTAIEKPKPVPVAPAPAPKAATSFTAPSAAVPDPGTAKAYAYGAVQARGWGEDQYSCLVSLWQKESGWRVNATNSSSGAYGIPQSLPGSKMGSAGPDWETNAGTQIEWGLGYIVGRYGSPCGAWAKSQASGWY